MKNHLPRRAFAIASIVAAAGMFPLLRGQDRDDGKVYAIRGATIHTLAGQPIEDGTVIIQGGRITGVGSRIGVPRGAQVVNAQGLHVYPGMLDAFSYVGLTEVGAVSATNDITEKGDFNPHLQAAIAVHPASEHIPVARANGITHAVVAPGGAGLPLGGTGRGTPPVIPGEASLMNLNGWTWEEMLVDPAIGMVLTWPTIDMPRRFNFGPPEDEPSDPSFRKAEEKYEERVAEIETWLEASRHYGRAKQAGSLEAPDSKLEALLPVVEGRQRVIVVANAARAIRNAVAFCQKHKLKMVLAGGAEAWKEKKLLSEKKIPVILGPTQAIPEEEDDPYDKLYSAPGELHEAGIKIAFGSFNSSDSRLLPYEAAMGVPFGLPREEALNAITRNPAEILGIADRFGTVEEGKVANLIVTDGDPLSITTEVRYLFIQGELTPTDNKHQQLYEKYLARP
ncbi:MAG: amidohydrolase family protein [Bryobacterales bacterium]